MESTEIWRPIPGCGGDYDVSDQGRVRSNAREVVEHTGKRYWRPTRMLRTTRMATGYTKVSLPDRALGTRRTRTVHRLVLEAFVGPAPDAMEGCHNDGNRANNRLSNLRWDTRSENVLDTSRHGTNHHRNRTHCPQSHELVGANLVPSKDGRRRCYACHKARSRARRRGVEFDPALADEYYRRHKEAS